MKNFNPGRWQDFPINKDIRRIKKDNSRTFWNRIQLLSSVLVVCVTLILEGVVCSTIRAWIAGGLCFMLLLVFVVPPIYYAFKDGRLAIKKYKTADLIRIFDEDIIYNTIISYEFYKEKSVKKYDSVIAEFYNIEQKYYFEKVIIDMKKINLYKDKLLNDELLTKERFNNVINTLKMIIKDPKMKISEEIKKFALDLGIVSDLSVVPNKTK